MEATMETLIATTARPVTFSHNGSVTRRPAGTEVYAIERRNGWFQVRIVGTLWTQTVSADSLMVP